MEYSLVYQVFAFSGLCVVLISFLVIAKTLGNIGISLLRMEYLIKRELELVRERERIKAEILRKQEEEEERRRRMENEADGVAVAPSAVKKG